MAVHKSSKLALDEDDKEPKEDDDKQAEDEEDDLDLAEDEDDESKEKAEDEEESEKKKDVAVDAAEVRGSIMNIFKAGREVEPLVGVIALDGFSSDHEVYAYALKQKGVDTKGINTAGLEALVKAHKSTSIAMDSAPSTPTASKGLKAFLDGKKK